MSLLLAVAAFVTVGGALVAVTGRDARFALAGLVAALAAATFLADPLPGPAGIAARIVAALLGGYLLYVVLRETTAATRGTLVGLPAEALAAAAAFVVGFGTSGLGSDPLGPAAAQATGFALFAAAVVPIVRGTDVFRLGAALSLLVTGAELVRVGLAGTPGPVEQLLTAGLTIGLLGTVAVLVANAVVAAGRLTLESEPRRGALYEAHPVGQVTIERERRSWRQRRLDRGWRPVRAGGAHRAGRGGGATAGDRDTTRTSMSEAEPTMTPNADYDAEPFEPAPPRETTPNADPEAERIEPTPPQETPGR